MLSYNDGVYYGSKKALRKFANEMSIINPNIQTATKTKMKMELTKIKKKKVAPPLSPIVEEEEDIEEDIEEDMDITALITDEPVKEEEEDIEKLAQVLHDVTVEKPLTKQEQEIVEALQKCIGI